MATATADDGAWVLPVTVVAPADVGRVMTPAGYEVDASTARRAYEATPANTRRSRESRASLFMEWCRGRGRVPTDPGTVPDYCAWLADQRHPADTIGSYVSPLAGALALSGAPLGPQDRELIARVIAHRSAEEATDPEDGGDALQATECTRADLGRMVATLDRTTVRGARDAFALILHWYIAGRASEPCGLAVHDVREVVADVLDLATGERTELAALEITFRRSKTNPHGRKRDFVRLVEQSDDLCPVRAWRAWMAVLVAEGASLTGPLLRRLDRWGKLGGTGGRCAGRQPLDARRAAGIGDRTIRNLIRDCARAARLVRELHPAERELLSLTAERAELAAAETDTEREAIRSDRRVRRRALRRSLPRYTGHSMRRGLVRHLERMGEPPHVIERAARFAPGSRARARYGVDLLPWADNPTVHMRRRQ